MIPKDFLSALNIDTVSGDLAVHTPIDGSVIATVSTHSQGDISGVIERSKDAFSTWRKVPAPRRGELIRLLCEDLRAHKQSLGELVSLECGKILSEGMGEVQEMIDICDFAVGLSRQLYGLTIASERPGHHMRETWQPLGPVAIISAFNFPVAVWAWNAALAVVCGNPVIWKPSEKTPLTALATQALFERAMDRFGDAPDGLSQVVIGAVDAGAQLVEDKRIALVSATGSCRMGRIVGPQVQARFGRSLLELGGNNAAIITPSADMDLAVRGLTFAAAGTAGQRCTSLRRIIAHESIAENLAMRMTKAFASLSVGDPLDADTLVGPLIDEDAFERFESAKMKAKEQGGTVHGGERVERGGGFYVRPALAVMPEQSGIVLEETFAPLTYLMTYSDLDEAIAMNNAVEQGLSSCIFTTDMREAEYFLSAVGSDCGIANVNIATSGAEIGGAFGGEKATGGGRESGSDSWRAYMRRQTQTVNYSHELPLAQGVKFDID